MRIAFAIAAAFASCLGAASADTTTRVSVDGSGVEGDSASVRPSISADGRFVAFMSTASNLVAGDTNDTIDIFVHDRATGATERISVDSSGNQADDVNWDPAISADGNVVAFWSYADNLVTGDTNGTWDVFVHDRGTGVTERVSVDSSGQEGDGWSYFPAISSDGNVVAFASRAKNLVANDTNGKEDIFVRDRAAGTTERVSVATSGRQGNDVSGFPSISADGLVVAFESAASTLVKSDTNGTYDAFVHDRTTGKTERVSVDVNGQESNGGSGEVSISADGRFVAFSSSANNLGVSDLNQSYDIYVKDRATGAVEIASVDSNGNATDWDSAEPAISGDGSTVVFTSEADNLVANDANFAVDVFVHDRSTGITERASVDTSFVEGDQKCDRAAVSGNGAIVVFDSYADNLVAQDDNGNSDVFARDRQFALWTNYGSGVAGTNGVPYFLAQQAPVLGTTITVDLGNSYGHPTVGLLALGFQRANLPTGLGGDLLLIPTLLVPISFSYGGDSFSGTLPNDPALLGFTLDLQGIELDPGAAKGVSFSAGLELVLGR